MPLSIAVIGQGHMGAAIARSLLAAGHAVTVWNRSPARCAPQQALGALVAPSAGAAIAAAELVITITSRCADLHPLFEAADTTGKDVVNLVTASPGETLALQDLVQRRGGHFLAGTIQCFPGDIGQAEALLLFAGDAALWQRRAGVLRLLGGAATHLGEAVAASNVVDTAITSGFVFGTEAVFLEAAAYASRAGLDIQTFGHFADQALTVLRSLLQQHVAAIAAGDFRHHGAPVQNYLSAQAVFAKAYAEAGASDLLRQAMATRMQRAVDAGDGDKALTALYLH